MKSIVSLCVLSFVCILSLDCIQMASADLEKDAIVQILDFFDKQNRLFERQRRYEFLHIQSVQKLDRKSAEVTLQYRFTDKYMTVDQTVEIKQSTFLFHWRDKGKLVVSPEGESRRVRWVLSSTWAYDRNREKADN